MSNVSARHVVVPFKAGDKAFSGQRLAKVGYKTTEKNPARFPSVAASIPQIDLVAIELSIQRLLPYIGTMLENAQDGVFRSLYESSNGSLREISDDDLSIEACIGWMEADAQGDRLTKESIERWFDSELSENLLASVAEKLGFVADDGSINSDQESVARKHVRIYRDVLAMLAGGKTILAEKQIRGCKNALSLAPDDADVMCVRLMARLTAMERKEQRMEEMLEL